LYSTTNNHTFIVCRKARQSKVRWENPDIWGGQADQGRNMSGNRSRMRRRLQE
jgi:hypothetical protein